MRTFVPGMLAAVLLAAGLPMPADARSPDGPVSLNGRALRDSAGEFKGLGASYFQAVRRAKFDRDRLRSDLRFLAAQGFGFVRVLSMVGDHPVWKGREIAPLAFRNRSGESVDGWPDYAEQLAAAIDVARECGLRTELTIFADAGGIMPERDARRAHLDLVLDAVRGREDNVILLEVANEAWQNGFPGDDGIAELREWGKFLADRTPVLVALSAPPGQTNEALEGLYSGSAADVATEHFSRDTRSPAGAWLPVLDVYRTNAARGLPPVWSNEPIGPGASVAAERDPLRLVCAAAFAWMSGLPAYVFHSAAGVTGEVRFEDTGGIRAFGPILTLLPDDIANWQRSNGRDADAPFATTAEADRQDSDTGAVFHLSCRKGDEFITLPIGIRPGGVELRARRALAFEALDPLTGNRLLQRSLAAGDRFVLKPGAEAVLIRGRWTGK